MFGFINSLFLATMYRLRGGGFFSLGGTTYARLVWAASLTLVYLEGKHDQLWAVWIMLAGFVSMLIPHAFCQNMGKWPTPQNGWPTIFFPAWTAAGWTAAPMWQRALYDAAQMGCVALLRAALVFGPLAIIGHYQAVIYAINTVLLLQPIGYLAGAYLMFFSLPSLAKDSTEWGEFFNGAAWAVAMLVYAYAYAL